MVSRNRLLAEALQRIGYVERAGYGVDMMCEQMLRLGKEPPGFLASQDFILQCTFAPFYT